MSSNTGPHAIFDGLGKTYVGLLIGWTVILAAGMGFLYRHRKLPALQMRRLPLVFSAITFYHAYGALCMIGYVIIQIAPCSVQYWVMNIYLPFGVALFQVANTQFLHIATQQRKFASIQSLDDLIKVKRSALDGQTGTLWQRVNNRLRNVDRITRMVIFIAIGMVVQAILALAIYLASRKFHPSFGSLDFDQSGTPLQVDMRCYVGWEWWLSIVWQFVWSWIYAPYLIWQSRKIEDTHGWRLQTILCCVAGLPASPLWLAGLYIPAFGVVNRYFIPPQWFSLCIFFIEIFTIFIPCYQVYKHHNLRTETLAAIAAWEAKSRHTALGINTTNLDALTVDSESTKVASPSEMSFKTLAASEKGIIKSSDKHASIITRHKSIGAFSTGAKSTSTSDSRKSHLYTLAALDHALKWNATPLQHFAAHKDFSGENIAFLSHLATWKRSWSRLERAKHSFKLPSEQALDEPEELREQFNKALRIYATFISVEYAEFPINVSGKQVRLLDDLFADAADLLFGDVAQDEEKRALQMAARNTATPFALEPPRAHGGPGTSDMFPSRTGSEISLTAMSGVSAPGRVWFWGNIPESFNQEVFDAVEKEIKYLVLTNTWPKFVNAGYAEQIVDSDEEGMTRKMGRGVGRIFRGKL